MDVHRLITPADVSSSMIDDQPIMSLDGIGPPPPPPAPAVVAAKDKFRIIIDSVAPPITDIHPFAARLAPIAIPGYSAYEQIPNPRRLLVPEGLVTASAEFWYVATPSSEARRQPGRDQRIQVSVGYADSSSRAREALAWLLVQSETRPTTLATSGGRLGDAAFQSSDKTVALVVYRNAVARVRSVGSRPAPVAEVLGRVALSFNEE